MDITTGTIVAAIGIGLGLIALVAALVSGGKKNLGSRPMGAHASTPPQSAAAGLSVVRQEFKHADFRFEIRYTPQTALTVEYSQLQKIANPRHPSGFQRVSGVLTIAKGTEDAFRVMIVLGLFDMTTGDDLDADIAYLEALGANGVTFETKHDTYITRAELFVDPKYVGEEGWCFEFETPLMAAYDQYEPRPTTASKVIADILTGQVLKFSICKREPASRALWEKSRFSGSVTHLMTVEFPFLDVLRDRFAKTFGTEVMRDFAQQKGLALNS